MENLMPAQYFSQYQAINKNGVLPKLNNPIVWKIFI